MSRLARAGRRVRACVDSPRTGNVQDPEIPRRDELEIRERARRIFGLRLVGPAIDRAGCARGHREKGDVPGLFHPGQARDPLRDLAEQGYPGLGLDVPRGPRHPDAQGEHVHGIEWPGLL